MTCPKCEHPKTIVVESRVSEGTHVRKRECIKCGHSFKTQEVPFDGQMHRMREKRPSTKQEKAAPVNTTVFDVWR